jgi:hypothetical protein
MVSDENVMISDRFEVDKDDEGNNIVTNIATRSSNKIQ